MQSNLHVHCIVNPIPQGGRASRHAELMIAPKRMSTLIQHLFLLFLNTKSKYFRRNFRYLLHPWPKEKGGNLKRGSMTEI